MPLVLASTSAYRRELLDRLGVPYVAAPHACDEAALAADIDSPDELARTLARAKAESLSATSPGAHILGCDQVVDLDGQVLGKPGGREAALEQLRALRGREHRLLTAVCLRAPDGTVSEVLDIHVLAMRDLGDDELGRYLDADQPYDCCGSYKIEARGIALFSAIRGDDFTGIVGLPLIAVTTMLRDAGFSVP